MVAPADGHHPARPLVVAILAALGLAGCGSTRPVPSASSRASGAAASTAASPSSNSVREAARSTVPPGRMLVFFKRSIGVDPLASYFTLYTSGRGVATVVYGGRNGGSGSRLPSGWQRTPQTAAPAPTHATPRREDPKSEPVHLLGHDCRRRPSPAAGGRSPISAATARRPDGHRGRQPSLSPRAREHLHRTASPGHRSWGDPDSATQGGRMIASGRGLCGDG